MVKTASIRKIFPLQTGQWISHHRLAISTDRQEGQQDVDITGDVGRDVGLPSDLGAETLQYGRVVQLLVKGHLLQSCLKTQRGGDSEDNIGGR